FSFSEPTPLIRARPLDPGMPRDDGKGISVLFLRLPKDTALVAVVLGQLVWISAIQGLIPIGFPDRGRHHPESLGPKSCKKTTNVAFWKKIVAFIVQIGLEYAGVMTTRLYGHYKSLQRRDL